jgi:hypothetical protein
MKKETIGYAPATAHNNGMAYNEGLTKREYFAAMAMQGLFAAQHASVSGVDNEWTAKTAANAADALIKALNSQP